MKIPPCQIDKNEIMGRWKKTAEFVIFSLCKLSLESSTPRFHWSPYKSISFGGEWVHTVENSVSAKFFLAGRSVVSTCFFFTTISSRKCMYLLVKSYSRTDVYFSFFHVATFTAILTSFSSSLRFLLFLWYGLWKNCLFDRMKEWMEKKLWGKVWDKRNLYFIYVIWVWSSCRFFIFLYLSTLYVYTARRISQIKWMRWEWKKNRTHTRK